MHFVAFLSADNQVAAPIAGCCYLVTYQTVLTYRLLEKLDVNGPSDTFSRVRLPASVVLGFLSWYLFQILLIRSRSFSMDNRHEQVAWWKTNVHYKHQKRVGMLEHSILWVYLIAVVPTENLRRSPMKKVVWNMKSSKRFHHVNEAFFDFLVWDGITITFSNDFLSNGQSYKLPPKVRTVNTKWLGKASH